MEGPDWTMRARIKAHLKPITGLTFDEFDSLYSIGLDRKICRFDNYLLGHKIILEKEKDPLIISYFEEFILVGMDGCQVRFLNPQTLLCRKIIAIGGIPKVQFGSHRLIQSIS